MARSMVYWGLEEPKKAKADFAEALRLAPQDSYFRWMRAVLSAHHKDWTRAETEAKAVLILPAHEKDARRLLALIYAVRAQKTPSLASKAMEQAELVSA